MITLKEIIDVLVIEYPSQEQPVNTDPYVVAWEKALSDYNRRASRKKNSEIDVVPNTASYPLPHDYVKMIVIDLNLPSGVPQSEGGGIIPGSTPGYSESYQLDGTSIKFVPTPNYTQTKQLWYGSGHVSVPYQNIVTWTPITDYEEGQVVVIDSFIYATVDVAGTSGATEPDWPTEAGQTILDGTVTWATANTYYPELVWEDVYIVLLKAKVNLIQNTAAMQAPGGLRYSLGELTIDRTRQAGFTIQAAEDLNQQYLDEVKARIGHLLSISYRQAEVRTLY